MSPKTMEEAEFEYQKEMYKMNEPTMLRFFTTPWWRRSQTRFVKPAPPLDPKFDPRNKDK